jgi:capsular polysaccharide biosynthesis protein
VEHTEPGYVAEFSGGIGWGHPTGGVFTADGRFAPAFTHDPCGGAFHTAWARLRLPEPGPLAGRTLYLVTPEATNNFHHWLIDLLPRLGLVQRAGYDLAKFDHVMLNFTGLPYQLATLAHLGLTADRLLPATAAVSVRAEQLVVPSLKASNQTLPAADVAWLRRSFLGEPQPARERRRIFLSRADASFRRLRNESALRPLLHEYGFEIISPGALSVPAQARLFAEAEVIAGPAGAAFANLVFAPVGARVVEIAPPQWLAAFHWMISARLGLEHTVVLGEGPVMRGVPDSAARRQDISLAPDHLAFALSGLTRRRPR